MVTVSGQLDEEAFSFSSAAPSQSCLANEKAELQKYFARVERSLHCTLPQVLRHRFQRFLRAVQLDLHLVHLQSGVDAFVFSLLLLPECFLCLGTRFEVLRAQTLDKH